MRDINRIPLFLDKFASIWAKYPNLRFGQLCSNFFFWLSEYKQKDPFYLEEDEMLEYLNEYSETIESHISHIERTLKSCVSRITEE